MQFLDTRKVRLSQALCPVLKGEALPCSWPSQCSPQTEKSAHICLGWCFLNFHLGIILRSMYTASDHLIKLDQEQSILEYVPQSYLQTQHGRGRSRRGSRESWPPLPSCFSSPVVSSILSLRFSIHLFLSRFPVSDPSFLIFLDLPPHEICALQGVSKAPKPLIKWSATHTQKVCFVDWLCKIINKDARGKNLIFWCTKILSWNK